MVENPDEGPNLKDPELEQMVLFLAVALIFLEGRCCSAAWVLLMVEA